MRKILMMLLVLAMTVCGVIGIAACDKEPDKIQDQGQIEQEKDKDKDKEEENPGQSQGGNEEEEEPEKKPEENSGQTNPPETPENQKPNPENPPKEEEPKEEEPKEEDPQPGEDEKPENPGGEEPNPPEEDPDDEPQGDDPSADDPDDDDPKPDTPTKPDDKDSEEDKKPDPQPQPQPQPEPKPDQENCEHKWIYPEAHGTDTSNTQHVAKCTICGKTQAEKCTWGTNGPVEHEPTCTKDGYKEYICTVCGHSLEVPFFNRGTQIKRALGHDYSGWVPIGTDEHKRTCNREGCDFVETAKCTITVTKVDAKCEQPGSIERKCVTCKRVDTETVAAVGHVWSAWTSLNNGQHKHQCTQTGCGAEETKPCDFEEKSRTSGSCTQKGEIRLECKDCHFTKTEENNQDFGHQYGDTNFCTKCGQDGLKLENKKMGGWTLNLIVRNQDLQNVKKIFIEAKYDNKDVHGIDSNAFSNFPNLETIFIPGKVFMIGSNAFEGSGLKTIYFEGTDNTWNRVNADGSNSKYFKDYIKGSFAVECNKKSDEVKSDWGISTSNAATLVALPAEVGKRVYA